MLLIVLTILDLVLTRCNSGVSESGFFAPNMGSFPSVSTPLLRPTKTLFSNSHLLENYYDSIPPDSSPPSLR